jgi:phage terminase large subunit-like protein
MALLHRQGLAGWEAIVTAAPDAVLSLPETPGGDWDVWLIEGDRATGKTTCAAQWLAGQVLAAPPGSLWGACAPTWDMARRSLEAVLDRIGPEGIESRSTRHMDALLRSKARIKGFWSESPGSIRGYNLAGAWLDDAHLMRHYSFWSDGLRHALRAGSRLVVTARLECSFGLVRDLEDAAEADGRVRLTVL